MSRLSTKQRRAQRWRHVIAKHVRPNQNGRGWALPLWACVALHIPRQRLVSQGWRRSPLHDAYTMGDDPDTQDFAGEILRALLAQGWSTSVEGYAWGRSVMAMTNNRANS